MAPELLNNTEGRPIDTEKADSALLAWPIHERLNLKLRQLCVVCVMCVVCVVCVCVVWSFGMFIVELITLDAPYAGLAEAEYARLISRGILPPNLPSVPLAPPCACACACACACQELSVVIIVAWQVKENKGVELVIKCCNLNPALRPSARDVVVYLNPLDDSCNAP